MTLLDPLYSPLDISNLDRYYDSARLEAQTRPNMFMAHLGYTRHPATCHHNRKKFVSKWICGDCGEDL